MHDSCDYIVILSPALGGAEKRFFDIFCGLLQKGKKIYLIVPSMLADILKAEYSDRKVFQNIIEIRMQDWSRIKLIFRFYKLLRSLNRGSRFHYPMNALFFLHAFRGDHLTVSICDCEDRPDPRLLTKRGFYTYLTLLFAEKIDVLSPRIYQWVLSQKLFKNKTRLTPGGTFIGVFPKDSIKKYPLVALIGRLEPRKGIIDFLDIFPKIWAIIKNEVPADFRMCIAGKGSLVDEVNRKIAGMQSNNIPIFYSGYVQVNEFLKPVSIVLSMQQITNYPSRVVAEALVSGAGVIVRNSGDSKLFGESLPGLTYCGPNLDAKELASLILGIFRQYKNNDQFGNLIRQKSRDVFCSGKYIGYFDSVIS